MGPAVTVSVTLLVPDSPVAKSIFPSLIHRPNYPTSFDRALSFCSSVNLSPNRLNRFLSKSQCTTPIPIHPQKQDDNGSDWQRTLSCNTEGNVDHYTFPGFVFLYTQPRHWTTLTGLNMKQDGVA